MIEDKKVDGVEDARGKTWADVGGLDGVRRTFEETILWPAKYPGIDICGALCINNIAFTILQQCKSQYYLCFPICGIRENATEKPFRQNCSPSVR